MLSLIPTSKTKKLLLFFLLGILCIAFLAIHFIAPTLILQPYRVKRQDISRLANFTSIAVTTHEGYRLVGVSRQVETPRAVVVLLHGIGSSKEIWKEEMEWLATQQIASFAFDNRAQGKSEGPYVTFGFYEKEDLSQIADIMEEQYPGIPLGIWGYSLGGAVALQSLAQERRWQFGIIESTFSRLDHTVRAYQKRHARGLKLYWLTDYSLKRAGQIGNFPPSEVKPEASALSINVPIFQAHGAADKNISVANAHRIHNNLRHPDNELVIIPNAGHESLYNVAGAPYFQRLAKFLNRVISPKKE